MKNQIFIPNIFQSEALREVDKAIIENEKSFLVVMPTGTGKTYLAAQWFRLQLRKHPKARLLYICHNQDILSQANDKEFANCLSEFDIPRGYYNKSEKNIGQVTFATVQTLRKNLDKLPSDYFDYIIVDEAHHYRANSFEKVIKHFTPKVLMGLTATPYRMDGKSILDVFSKTIYNASISSGIKNGLLSKIKYYCVDNDIDFSEIKHNSNGHYSEKDLNKKICVKEYDDAIIKEYTDTIKQKHTKKKTICFCATIEHAYRMEKLFNDNGIKAVALTGKRITEKGTRTTIHDRKRKQIINMFRNGNYDIIFVRDLFNEGMDIPDADCIIMLRPTESSRIFTQQIGRGLRISEGKDYLLALDFTGNCYRCDINYEVLSDIIDVDLEKEVKDKIRNNNKSEIIIQNIGCEVRLSKKKIDVIKMSEENTVTKEKLIENYFNLKNKLGRQPTTVDLNRNSLSLYSHSSYRHFFGSWAIFLESINEKYTNRNYGATENELIDNYFSVKEKLGRQPNEKNLVKSGISLFNFGEYIKYFGSWSNFLDKINEKKLFCDQIPEKELIENYFNVKKDLNKFPTCQEMDKYGKFSIGTYINRFDSWNKFLFKIGEKKNDDRKRISDEELIKNYWELKDKYPRLTSDIVSTENGSRFSRVTYFERFGSWKKFLNKINESHHISETDLIDNYMNVKKDLNKSPMCQDMDKYGKFKSGVYIRRFGSWSEFLLKIGESIDRKRISDDELIRNYWDLKNKYVRLTSRMVSIKNGSRYDRSVYFERFGSWNKFLLKIGEKLNNANRITDEELILNYLDLKNKYPLLTSKTMSIENGSKFSYSKYVRRFGSWTKFIEMMNEKSIMEEKSRKNITIISDYIPKNQLPDQTFGKSGRKSHINTDSLLGYRYRGTENKYNIRQKIIEKIQDGDIVLMLESPELEGLKEIEKQGKNPKKIIIPNHVEFDELAKSLEGYDTNLNIEVINISALQYIVDHPEEHFSFLWLDYCGGFSYYTRDLDMVFQRDIRDMRLILTYNVFDPKKKDDGYYFTNVIGYVLKKLRGKNDILLIEDVSQRYKKTMFSVGFDIKKSILQH